MREAVAAVDVMGSAGVVGVLAVVMSRSPRARVGRRLERIDGDAAGALAIIVVALALARGGLAVVAAGPTANSGRDLMVGERPGAGKERDGRGSRADTQHPLGGAPRAPGACSLATGDVEREQAIRREHKVAIRLSDAREDVAGSALRPREGRAVVVDRAGQQAQATDAAITGAAAHLRPIALPLQRVQ